MKSLIQAVAVAVALGAPIVSMAQTSGQAAQQGVEVIQSQAASQQGAARVENSGYGSGSHGSWQAGRGGDVTFSSYSPPVYNAR
ncbi:hypothetical protein C8K18_105400 [Paraburkholderia sp. GV068]|jgi:hypothetical protein|uniref:Uncharacterized protein n=1 Tax=Paraburkholderia graminis (strain ATCC 700544 / DSM 17151 / LMG 18924 / NCIMB 13744 / C4D1M) TaxID=396598 RepID=B1GA69_PARG4|nr:MULTISPECIES: hypothetical protein [Paraburkholderia]EDT07000.1 conserved hypothetical protein [Paraburkholderia graminis C4D1M]PTR00628.1 hypothetical protein C8K19_105399 [Paraburkholderia sp. GV072]PUB05477.1 hypothetical protein C8K18_105400 [Paraburkholderia sp. GV068]CAB3641258.1 hypothetical protein R8871_00300 [Paraburkholderia graminis C4D1M]